MRAEITIIVYFIFLAGIGIYSSFKIKRPSDYYVAGKKAGLIPVSGSFLATILGGSAILGTIELSQKTGWAALWFLFSASIGLIVLSLISKKVRRYGNFTLPELLGKFYGKKAEQFATLIIPLAWIGIVAAQIIAAAKILHGLDLISYQNAAIVAGIIFIGYTLLGGQLSIIKTDALQALLIIVGLTIIFFFAKTTQSPAIIKPFKLSALFNPKFTVVDLLVLLLTYSVTFVVGPDIYSRIFCAKNEKTAQQSALLVAALLIPVSFILTYIGIFSQSSGEGITTFARVLMPEWAYGLFMAALLSAVMSSADTTLLTSSIILSELFAKNLETRKALILTRWFIVASGLLSIIIALYVTSVIQSLLLALSFFSGAFVVPILCGLLKIRVNKSHVLWAMALGGLTALTGKLVNIYTDAGIGNYIIIFSYLVNIVVLLIKRESSHS